MRKCISLKIPAAVSRIAFFALLFVTMAAATLHLGALTAQAAQTNLSWTAPATNTDGTTITNLAGYKLHIGSSPGNYQQSVDVGNLTSYSDSSLNDASTYYFAVTAYSTSGVTSAYSNEISRSFPAVSYLITATAGSSGTITAQNNTKVSAATNGTTTVTNVTVSVGASQAFSIAAAAGYSIGDVKVDGASVGPVASYSFSNVNTNHTIAASFVVVNNYSISASAGVGGTISPAGTASINSGASKSFTIAPNVGYKVADVKVDGVSVGAVASYTFSNITANHSIQANFAAVAGNVVSAINCGGSKFTDSTGVVYNADTFFSGGSMSSTTASISGTIDDALYKTWRSGTFSYSIPMTNGNYSVTLKFSDNVSVAGQRVFDVLTEGVTQVSRLDIFAAVGTNTAKDVTVPVSVSGGVLNINFKNIAGYAKLNAVLVKSR